MSFLDKFKGKARDADRRDDDLASMFDEVVPMRPDDMALAGAVRRRKRSLTLDMSHTAQAPGDADHALVDPVRCQCHGKRRRVHRDPHARPEGEAPPAPGLPLIGHLPLAQQQRALIGRAGARPGRPAGGSWLAVTSANDSAAQVGASGQALMQSQRLAKSVSQALLGSDSAFGKCAKAPRCWARTCAR